MKTKGEIVDIPFLGILVTLLEGEEDLVAWGTLAKVLGGPSQYRPWHWEIPLGLLFSQVISIPNSIRKWEIRICCCQVSCQSHLAIQPVVFALVRSPQQSHGIATVGRTLDCDEVGGENYFPKTE